MIQLIAALFLLQTCVGWADADSPALKKMLTSAQRERMNAVPPPSFAPCEPESDFATESSRQWSTYESVQDDVPVDPPGLDFCAEWNPEFPFNGHHCCRNFESIHHRKVRMSCFSRRHLGSFCEEMTEEQRDYISSVQSGRAGDVLQLIAQDLGANRQQSFCTFNNGFLAHGRPVVPTEHNRLAIRTPDRCTQFGNDRMVGMIEWLGRRIDEQFPKASAPGVRLVVGDIAAPRGGCLSGITSIVGHRSHTNGADADIGFLSVRGKGKLPSPVSFHFDFDPESEWWLMKQVFHNPYACVKVIFLDRKLIRKLAKYARNDPEWAQYGRFFRHMPGHKNHTHIRIGSGPGGPGCARNAHPELEQEGDDGEIDSSPGPGDLGLPSAIKADFKPGGFHDLREEPVWDRSSR